MNQVGQRLARQRETYIAAQGTLVFWSGMCQKAMIHHSDHSLLRSVSSDGDSPDKSPIVLVFGGSAWGRLTEGARVRIGGDVLVATASGVSAVAMAREFLVAAPLHPKWRQGVVTELAVVAYPD